LEQSFNANMPLTTGTLRLGRKCCSSSQWCYHESKQRH